SSGTGPGGRDGSNPASAKASRAGTGSPSASGSTGGREAEGGTPGWTRISIAPIANRAAAASASAASSPIVASTSTRRRLQSARRGNAGLAPAARSFSSRAVTALRIDGVAGYASSELSPVSADATCSVVIGRSPIPGSLQLVTQSPEGAREPRLHGPGPDRQRSSGLGLRELEQVAVGDDQPLRLRETLDGPEQRLPFLAPRGRVPRAAVLREPNREPLAPAHRPPPVLRLVGHDPKDPRPERLAGPEPVERVERLHERLLCGVLGLGGASRDQPCGAERHLPVPLQELAVGLNVTVAREPCELDVLQWTALHSVGHPALHRAGAAGSAGRVATYRPSRCRTSAPRSR